MYEQKTENFRAFARLYGYIRFFHPSDEAASLDWDKFAIYGMEQVESAQNNEELKTRLEELFRPIAPSIDIFQSNAKYEYDLSRFVLPDTSGLLPVAWQHTGIGVSRNSLYKNVRRNRIKYPVNSAGSVSKSINAGNYWGKKLRLRVTALSYADDDKNHGLLWLRNMKKDGKIDTNDILGEKIIRSYEMEEYEIFVEVSSDADKILFGYSLCGEGVVLADKFILEVNNVNGWEKIEFDNPDFENDKAGFEPAGWELTKADYDYEVISFTLGTGKQCCKIESIYENQLFDKFPQPGEYFVKKISGKLSCVVPLCLYSDSHGTIPNADIDLLKALLEKINKINLPGLNADNVYLRLACIAVTWNVLQHSYPYFDLYDIDWESFLDEYLNRAYRCSGDEDLTETMDEMLALINDCHAMVKNTNNRTLFYFPPFQADFAEGKLVISRLYDEEIGLSIGDIIVEIDGKLTEDLIKQHEKRISAASAEWKKVVLLRILFRKRGSSDITLKLKRGEEIIERTLGLNYTLFDLQKAGDYREYRPEKICEVQTGKYYVDLSRASYSEIEEKLSEIATANGVIFDLRGYPNSNDGILCHLIEVPLNSVSWDVPQIIYPDRENLVGYDSGDKWNVEPLKPRITGKVVFLTNGNAMSYAESVMGIVEAYKLGTIVGENTAGTNGNINTINLPGGYFVNFTGMRILKHDGSRHHGIGIIPDVPVSRTIKGIKEKRDEFLEKAIEIIENK